MNFLKFRNRCVALAQALVCTALVAVGLGGCAAQEELPPQMAQNLTEMRDFVTQGKSQILAVNTAARDLTQRPQAQLQPQYERLNRAIGFLEQTATNNRTQFATTDEHAQSYFAHWNKQLQGMSESLAEAGRDRHAKAVASFEELKIRVEALKKEFRPYMNKMNEVSKYLGTDMTAAGVKTVTPQIKEGLDSERSLMSKADAVIAQIDAMRGGK